jgi:hypothetical protein
MPKLTVGVDIGLDMGADELTTLGEAEAHPAVRGVPQATIAAGDCVGPGADACGPDDANAA